MIDEFQGKVIADKYRVDSLLRESDLGGIYRGWHVTMDKPVTVKILATALAVDARYVTRFLAEAKAAAGAAHPGLLNVSDFGTDRRHINYTVYEAADGVPLSELLAGGTSLPVGQALEIAKQTAAALAKAHAHDVFHGGLNPGKVLVSGDDGQSFAKVFDLGVQPLARIPNADLAYLAPEQYVETTRPDARADVYALGVMLYEMLAGRLPFIGSTTAELTLRQEQEPPAPLVAFRDDLPADLEPMILSALAVDPEKRYQKMSAFAEDLELVARGLATPAVAAATHVTPKRNIWQTAFIALVGISLLAAVLIYATSVKQTNPTTNLQADAMGLPVQPIGPATGAQEESLARLPAMTESEMMLANSNMAAPDTLPGGDGYNAWANGGAPPIGAPPPQNIPPGGQVYTIDPNGGSQFMPQEGGVILVPVPANTANTSVKPTPTPRTPPANGAPQATPTPASTPKPMATPTPKNSRPGSTQPTTPATKPPKTGKPADPS